ncbi:2-phospho-L-lactate guanylyltransferase [Candidatus Nitrososphaera sp. FF02]|uniref:2-phospho-L-lactate guanylyltransferase n=1 Tax=Candidatus Nitrososphaera sp. FF02 TaxID=3398226 RepID=UPI0039E973E0
MTIAIIPVKKFENAKTRLSSILDVQRRAHLSELMLQDTLVALGRARSVSEIAVVSSDRRAKELAEKHGATVLAQERDSGVNSAVALGDAHAEKNGAAATLVVPADLPLLVPADVDALCALAGGRCIVICPSLRYDGTNVLLRMPPSVIPTSYDNNSYEAHVRSAKDAKAAVHVAKMERLMFDVDTPEDARQLASMPGEKIGAKETAAFLKRMLR